MKTKKPILLCVLFCLSLAALPCVYASDLVGAKAPLLAAGRADDDPFGSDPFGNETDDSAISGPEFPDPIQGFKLIRSRFVMG